MAFLSDIFTGTVGEIKIDAITEINQVYDDDYVYATGRATADGNSLYFSYMPTEVRDVPIGAFRIVLNSESTKSISGVSCAIPFALEEKISLMEKNIIIL